MAEQRSGLQNGMPVSATAQRPIAGPVRSEAGIRDPAVPPTGSNDLPGPPVQGPGFQTGQRPAFGAQMPGWQPARMPGPPFRGPPHLQGQIPPPGMPPQPQLHAPPVGFPPRALLPQAPGVPPVQMWGAPPPRPPPGGPRPPAMGAPPPMVFHQLPPPGQQMRPGAPPPQGELPRPPHVPQAGPTPLQAPLLRPPELSEAAPRRPEPQVTDAEAERERILRAWGAHKSGDGKVYYFNSITSESSWTKPIGFKGAATEAVPSSQLRVPGTVWFEVHCEDGRKYYYNERTEETSWTAPAEVAAVKQQVQEARSGVLGTALYATGRNAANGNLPDDPVDVTYSEDDIGAPPLPDEPPGANPPLPAAEPEEPQKPKEQLTSDFHDLLAEKGVTPFSRWERELPKLISEERYQAIPSLRERKQLFEEFCKSSADFRKRGKAWPVATKPERDSAAAKTAFEALLTEAASTSRALEQDEMEEGEAASRVVLQAGTPYEDLEKSLGKDPRWTACTERLRKEAFEAAVRNLKSAEKQMARRDVEALEEEFRALLISAGINGSSRWSKSKDSLAKDPRYKAVARDSRERIFRGFVAALKKEEEEREQERKEREKKEQAAKDRLKRDTEEAERRRKKAAHADAISNYMTLLSEVVKDPDAHWSDWKAKLQRDPQKRADRSVLDSRDAESRFRDFVSELHKKACLAFNDLLEEVVQPLLPDSKEKELPGELRSFSKADKLFADDPRSARISSKEREKLWRRFVDDIVLERDDPERAARRARLSGRSRAPERPPILRDGNEQRDKAYEREYLSHDRKRLRKE